jgi:hypothetical protein
MKPLFLLGGTTLLAVRRTSSNLILIGLYLLSAKTLLAQDLILPYQRAGREPSAQDDLKEVEEERATFFKMLAEWNKIEDQSFDDEVKDLHGASIDILESKAKELQKEKADVSHQVAIREDMVRQLQMLQDQKGSIEAQEKLKEELNFISSRQSYMQILFRLDRIEAEIAGRKVQQTLDTK